MTETNDSNLNMPDEGSRKEDKEKFIVELEEIEKTLGNKRVLDGMDLRIKKGETMVILGRSGTGKSVTLKHIVGLMKPDRGTVRMMGKDLHGIPQKELDRIRKDVGFLFQDGALLGSLSVMENIALPLHEHSSLPDEKIRERVMEKLNIVGLKDFADVKPDVLSGGMRKRVGLARAIIRNPKLILYDEPTHGLDPIMATKINNLILDLKEQLEATSVVVTHDIPSALLVADRIAMLYKGTILRVGEPYEFLESEDPLIKQFIYGDQEFAPLESKMS